MKVVDEKGFVLENGVLVCYNPDQQKAQVFRILSRENKGFETFNYGALPLSSGDTIQSLDGTSGTVSADGVIDSRAFTQTGLKYSLADVYDENDMWYVKDDYRKRLFHVKQKVTPAFLRCDIQIPINITQQRFQAEEKITGVDQDLGFSRGFTETVHFPKIHYGYRYGNDTNVGWYTHVQFNYAEYVVEIPKDPEIIFRALTQPGYAYWLTIMIHNYDSLIERAFNDCYGIEGFPLYPHWKRDAALKEYREILGGALI